MVATPDAAHPGSPAATKWVLFSDSLVSPQLQQEQLRIRPGTIFSYLAGRFLHAQGRQLLPSLHRSCINNASRNRLRGSTSDLLRSFPEASAGGGSPCGGCLRPWFLAGSSTATAPCTPAPLYCTLCTVPVYKPLRIRVQ